MALQTSAHNPEIDLFRQELVTLINNQHPLVKLAAKIDWQASECRFDSLYASGVGRPGHPIRLMVGLQLLKHTSNAVEPVIGHMKSDGRLARNFLKGAHGDAINALLCGAGHNMRKILKKLRLLCA